MDLKTTVIDGKVMEVIDSEIYRQKMELYNTNNTITFSTAMQVTDGGKEYILPFRPVSDDRPGVYPDGCIYFVRYPKENDHRYDKDNHDIVDFGSVNTIEDFLNKNGQIREMETSVLSDVDTVFCPIISQEDTPAMKLFKEAIIAKRIDINKYAPRFGDNFLNDVRIMKTPSITLKKLVDMSEKLDIEAQLVLRDKNATVANPMKRELSIVLTGGGGDNNND